MGRLGRAAALAAGEQISAQIHPFRFMALVAVEARMKAPCFRRIELPTHPLIPGAPIQKKDNRLTFNDFGLDRPTLKAPVTQGHDTPIQTKAIPPILAGRDVAGIAQTGPEKAAAFTPPLSQRLSRTGGATQSSGARALVLAPTPELSSQICKAERNSLLT